MSSPVRAINDGQFLLADWFTGVEVYLDGESLCWLMFTSRELFRKYGSPKSSALWVRLLRDTFPGCTLTGYMPDDSVRGEGPSPLDTVRQVVAGTPVEFRPCRGRPRWISGTIASVREQGEPCNTVNRETRTLGEDDSSNTNAGSPTTTATAACVKVTTFNITNGETGDVECDVPRLRIRFPGQTQPKVLRKNEHVEARFRLRRVHKKVGDDLYSSTFCRAWVLRVHEPVRPVSPQLEASTNVSSEGLAIVPGSDYVYDLQYDDGACELRVPRHLIEAQHRDGLSPEKSFSWALSQKNELEPGQSIEQEAGPSYKVNAVNARENPVVQRSTSFFPLPLCQRMFLFRLSEWLLYRRELVAAGIPSQKQLWNFVNRVANHHSWYKHLPLQRVTTFEFVCNLASNMRLERERHVEYTEDDGTRFHYTWTTTAQYRKNYHYFDWKPNYDDNAISQSFFPSKLRDGKLITKDNDKVPTTQTNNSAKVSAVVHGIGHDLFESAFVLHCEDPTRLQKMTPPEGMGRFSRRFHSVSAPLPPEVLQDFDSICNFLSKRNAEGAGRKDWTENQDEERRQQELSLLRCLFPKANSEQIKNLHKVLLDKKRRNGGYAMLAQYAERTRQRLAMAEALRQVCVQTYGNHPQFELDLNSKEATWALYC